MNKHKGTRAERELLHLFFDNGWSAARVAGSGSVPEPSCDLLAGNGVLMAAIECKACKTKKKYLRTQQIDEFKGFAKTFGLSALIAIKFDRNGWWFISPDDLDKTKTGLAISLEDIKIRGRSFEQLIIDYPTPNRKSE